jgi:hypothetical protein
MKDLFAEDNQTRIVEQYIVHSVIRLVSDDSSLFTLRDIEATFHCRHNFKSGDRVKITIEKEIDLGQS